MTDANTQDTKKRNQAAMSRAGSTAGASGAGAAGAYEFGSELGAGTTAGASAGASAGNARQQNAKAMRNAASKSGGSMGTTK